MNPEEAASARLIGAVIEGSLSGLAGLAKLFPQARPERHNVRVHSNLAYQSTGSAAHLLDVYVPTTGTGPFPAVMYVHGGGFRILSKDTHFAMALAFARRGMVVFNVNYRLAPRHRYPAALEDLSHAFAWIKDNAARYGADVNRLFLAGESAGANLVSAMTVAAVMERPEAYAQRIYAQDVVPIGVMPACGILQATEPQRFSRYKKRAPWVYERIETTSTSYLGASAHAPSATNALADPLLILESDAPASRAIPPFFAGVGTRDPLIDDTRRLASALDKRGVRNVIEVYPGEVHAFHAFVWRSEAKRFWRDTYRFIDSCLNA